jgi:hypothetical protein
MKAICRVLMFACAMGLPLAGGLFAQGGPPPCWPPPCIPIDGGLSFLIGAGALLGGKRILDLRRQRSNAQG